MEVPRRVGEYQLIEEIGSGTSGEVYRALDVRLQREVAVKVLRGGAFSTHRERERLMREARALARINHPSIVPIYDVGVEDGVPFLVTKLIEGTTLGGRADSLGWSNRTATEVVAQIADAISAAHENGIVHRDLKPSNVLIDSSDHPYVTDFGLAKLPDASYSLTQNGQVIGTPAYMSPEQAAGCDDEVDHRSDIYSLGAILYELLTGVPPFQGTAERILHQVRWDEPVAPRARDTRIEPDLETICLRALHKRPSSRFASAAQLAEDLRRFLAGEPIHSRPVGRWERSWRWCRRHPRTAIGVFAVTALLVTTTVISVEVAARFNRLASQERHANTQLQKLRDEENRELTRLKWQKSSELAQSGAVAQSLIWGVDAMSTDTQGLMSREAHIRRLEFARRQTLTLETCLFVDAEVTCAQWSPNGDRLVAACRDGTVTAWDSEHWTPRELLRYSGPVDRIAVAPDGSLVACVANASGRKEAQLLLCPIHHVEAPRKVTLDSHVSSLAFCPDASSLLVGTFDGRVIRCDQEGDLTQIHQHAAPVRWIASARDGSIALSASLDGSICKWRSTDKGQPHALLTKETPLVVDLSEDGRRLLAVSQVANEFPTLRVWATDNFDRPLWSQRMEDPGTLAFFSKDGDRLLCKEGRACKIYDSDSGDTLGSVSFPSPIHAAAWSSDRQRIYAIGGPNRDRPTLCVVDTHPSGPPLSIDFAHVLRGIAVAPDGYYCVAFGDDRCLRVWSPPRLEVEQDTITSDPPPRTVVAAIDGTRFIASTGDGGLSVVGPSSDPVLLKSNSRRTERVLSDSQGRFILTTTHNGTVEVFDTKEDSHQELSHAVPITCATMDPEGRLIATTANDGELRLYELPSLALTSTFALDAPKPAVMSLSPDRLHVAVGTSQGVVVIVDVKSRVQRELSPAQGVATEGLRFFGSRPYLAWWGPHNAIQIWDVVENKMVGQTDPYHCIVAFAPDRPTCRFVVVDSTGKLDKWQVHETSVERLEAFDLERPIAAAAVDWNTLLAAVADTEGYVSLWDIATGRSVGLPIHHIGRISALGFSAESKTLFSVVRDRNIRLWPLTHESSSNSPVRDYSSLLNGRVVTDGAFRNLTLDELRSLSQGRQWRISSPGDRANWHLKSASRHMTENRLTEATFHSEWAVRLVPDRAPAYRLRAECHARAEKPDWASIALDFSRSAQLGDDSVATLYRCALCSLASQNTDLAKWAACEILGKYRRQPDLPALRALVKLGWFAGDGIVDERERRNLAERMMACPERTRIDEAIAQAILRPEEPKAASNITNPTQVALGLEAIDSLVAPHASPPPESPGPNRWVTNLELELLRQKLSLPRADAVSHDP